jgi:SanA protein
MEEQLLNSTHEPQITYGDRTWPKWPFVLFILFLSLTLAPLVWRRTVRSYYAGRINTPSSAPSEQVAIVFGAAVYGNGRLSSVLRDRMETAITLYQSEKINKILVSGDNSFDDYNEPGAMMAYAIERGIPPEDIQPDYGGRRTYDTCYRAREIFQLDSAILVTQEFHLPRALFTCRLLGIEAIGVSADLRSYRGARWYEIRETAATLNALWDVIRQNPPAVLGEPIPFLTTQS